MDVSDALEVMKLAGVGLVSGLFATLMASKDHRFKKWWELRVAAYQVVIEALSDLLYCYDRRYIAHIEGRELSEKFERQLEDQREAAFPRVRKAADSGAFLFSDEANAALATFIAATNEDYQMYQDYLDSMQFEAKKCLTKLVELSKEDLKLHRHFFIWN
jgi:hypothetical protein